MEFGPRELTLDRDGTITGDIPGDLVVKGARLLGGITLTVNGSIGGDVTCDGDVICASVGGDVTARGNVSASVIGGDVIHRTK